MGRNKKLYSPEAVYEYIERAANEGAMIDALPGSLIDTYILEHAGGVFEIWEETYLNCWSSAYTRHIYKKGLPARWQAALDEYWKEAENA